MGTSTNSSNQRGPRRTNDHTTTTTSSNPHASAQPARVAVAGRASAAGRKEPRRAPSPAVGVRFAAPKERARPAIATHQQQSIGEAGQEREDRHGMPALSSAPPLAQPPGKASEQQEQPWKVICTQRVDCWRRDGGSGLHRPNCCDFELSICDGALVALVVAAGGRRGVRGCGGGGRRAVRCVRADGGGAQA